MNKGLLALCMLLASGTSFCQLIPIEARFEPRCDAVIGYFAYSQNDAVSYLWEFGDGDSSTSTSPVHSFPFGAAISVTLTRVDANGESATFSRTFVTQDQLEFSDIDFPNVFTPNGDGVNDQFSALNNELLGPCAELYIYNRYGQLIFNSLGTDLSWDGYSFTGEPVSAGVYFYEFNWSSSKLNASVTLLR